MSMNITSQILVMLAVVIGGGALISLIIFSMNGGSPCAPEEGYIRCGYCSQDAMLSDNPNAGKCRYCPSGTTCSFDDICGDLSCVSGGSDGGGGGGGGGTRYCDYGYCYSSGYCCPGYAKYFCKDGCYDTSGAHANGCYTLKAICY